MPMNPEIKARWTAALRSGEYPQAPGWLRATDGYCCLGVLCDLAVKDGIITETAPEGRGHHWEYNSSDILLPAQVMTWAGLNEPNPHIAPDSQGVSWDTSPDDNEGGYMIANANDGGTPFPVIADIIDAQF